MPNSKRPFGVRVVTLLLLLLAGSTAYLAWRGRFSLPWDFPSWMSGDTTVRTVGYGVATLLVVSAVGMWRLRRSAWVATMLLVGTFMVVELRSYGRGHPHYSLMALCMLIAFYLNQRDVQNQFHGPTAHPG